VLLARVYAKQQPGAQAPLCGPDILLKSFFAVSRDPNEILMRSRWLAGVREPRTFLLPFWHRFDGVALCN
jgi:hypothetical protein